MVVYGAIAGSKTMAITPSIGAEIVVESTSLEL